jgi:hypothetical protein
MITIGMILFFYQLYESKKHNSHEINIWIGLDKIVLVWKNQSRGGHSVLIN